jgi:excisionase family DNA binding protein
MTAETRLAYGPDEAARVMGMSRDTLERAIQRGAIKSWTVGRRRFVSAEELRRFMAEREAASN